MNSHEVKKLISYIGESESKVQSDLNVPLTHREEIFEGYELYFYVVEPGLELGFMMPTQRFTKMCFQVAPSAYDPDEYTAELPFGISKQATKLAIREHWGEPFRSVPPNKLIPDIESGGTDFFRIPDHPDKQLIVGYTVDGKIKAVHVELL